MFKKWFGKAEEPAAPATAGEILGFRLGGSFELDKLKVRLIEPQLIVEGMAATHLIQAVGEVQLDETSTLLRYYTDDEGYIQVLLTGGRGDNNVSDVKLWYYYDTQSVGSDSDWEQLLNSKVSQKSISLEGHTYERVWESVGDANPPIAMTEKTVNEEGKHDSTDQFAMLYQRELEGGLFEYVLFSAEEKVIDGQLDRCFVTSTGFDLAVADFQVVS